MNCTCDIPSNWSKPNLQKIKTVQKKIFFYKNPKKFHVWRITIVENDTNQLHKWKCKIVLERLNSIK